MSLMNDMLRDLEARDATPPVESVRHTGSTHRRRWALPVLGGIAVLATGLLAAWLIRDIPAVAGSAPDRDAAVGAVSRPRSDPNPSPTDSAPTPRTTHPVGAVSDRDPSQTQTESPADPAVVGAVSRPRSDPDPATAASAPATQQSNNAIVVRPAGRSRDATAENLDSARRALARGQTGVAISRLQALLERRPELAEARILLARTLLASGRPRRAEAILDEGLTADPGNHELAFWLARNRLEQNRPEAALEALQAHTPAIEEAPDFHLLLGAALHQLKSHEQALETYRDITEVFPANVQAWLGQALSAEAVGQVDAARAAYRRTLEHGDARTTRLARQRLNALSPASQGIE